MIPVARPLIGEEEKKAVLEVLDSGILAAGKKVIEFESQFAKYIGSKYAIAVNSGTAALQIALMANGIGRNEDGRDEVITTPFSFIATANSILWAGGRPVFADIDEYTFNIDPNEIEEKITDKTKAILPVHLYGMGANMKSIMKIAGDYGLEVIEDACQAVGLKSGIGCGTTCYSFYPTKNMTTGEGGMITTDDPSIADKCRLIRSHGSTHRYIHVILGYNFRMTDVAAAIGIEQLKKLDDFCRKRQENARYMNSKLEKVKEIITPYEYGHVFNQYTIRVKNRDRLLKLLQNKGIGAEIYYPIPIHRQPLYMKLGYSDYLRNTEKICKEVISLPIHPEVSKDNIDYIVEVIKEYMNNN